MDARVPRAAGGGGRADRFLHSEQRLSRRGSRPARRALLAGSPLVQAVLPYEPYYKLQSSLLGLAVDAEAAAAGHGVEPGPVRGGRGGDGSSRLKSSARKSSGADRSPFGPVVRVLAAGGLDGAGAAAGRADCGAGTPARAGE